MPAEPVTLKDMLERAHILRTLQKTDGQLARPRSLARRPALPLFSTESAGLGISLPRTQKAKKTAAAQLKMASGLAIKTQGASHEE